MKAAKHILTSCFGRKRLPFASFTIVSLFITSTLALSLFNIGRVGALETCRFSGTIAGAQQTEGDVAKSTVIGDQLCIGPAFGPSSASGASFFEFIVKFNGPVENANIHFKNDDGNSGGSGNNGLSGNFRKVNNTTYVVEPANKGGYSIPYNFQSSLRCNAADEKRAGITVTVDANGKHQEFKFNLCDGANYNRDYTVARTADQIPADGQQGSTKGRITGEFTTTRWGAAPSAPERNGRSNKRCVVDITLNRERGSTQRGDANSDWYSLTNGVIEIPNLEPDKYDLTITYNDRLCMQQDFPGAQAAWTGDKVVVEAKGIEVKAGEDAHITLTNAPPGNTDPGGGSNQPADQPVCTTGNGLAGAIAWILCPLAALIANATAFIEQNLILPYLTVSPFTTDNNNPAYLLWQSVRNIANVLFIIAFFIVIFSQATSIGLSNYGIKRLLPRIGLVAIFTNLSYFFASFIIDTFNIFGAGAGQLVMEALKQAHVGDQNYDPSAGQFWALGGIALAAVLIKAGPILGWLFGLIGMAFLIILVAVIVLVIRQMLIILLVVVSPLAFVAWLLPNTENYFSKWLNLLIKLLLMYPFIVLLFASGKIFGALLGSPDYNLGGIEGGQSSGFAEVIRVVMQFIGNCIPLLLLPLGLQAGGAILSKLTRNARRIAGRVGQGAVGGIRGSRLGQFAQEKIGEYKTRRRGTPPPTSGAAAYTPGNLKRRVGQGIRSSTLFNRATGGFGTYLDRENAAARKEMNDKAAKFLGDDLPAAFALESAGGSSKALKDIIKNGGYYGSRKPDGTLDTSQPRTKINAATSQRLQQFLGAGNYKGVAAARAIAHTLADTSQLNHDKYARLATMVGDTDGAVARDEFIADQNVYNEQKGFSNLGQAAWTVVDKDTGKMGLKQYAGSEYGLKEASGVFSAMKLREAKKQVLEDPSIAAEIRKKAFIIDANDNVVGINQPGFDDIMMETARMQSEDPKARVASVLFGSRKDNPKAVFNKTEAANSLNSVGFRNALDAAQARISGASGGGRNNPGGGTNPPNGGNNPPTPTPRPPSGGGGGGGGPTPPAPTFPNFPSGPPRNPPQPPQQQATTPNVPFVAPMTYDNSALPGETREAFEARRTYQQAQEAADRTQREAEARRRAQQTPPATPPQNPLEPPDWRNPDAYL